MFKKKNQRKHNAWGSRPRGSRSSGRSLDRKTGEGGKPSKRFSRPSSDSSPSFRAGEDRDRGYPSRHRGKGDALEVKWEEKRYSRPSSNPSFRAGEDRGRGYPSRRRGKGDAPEVKWEEKRYSRPSSDPSFRAGEDRDRGYPSRRRGKGDAPEVKWEGKRYSQPSSAPSFKAEKGKGKKRKLPPSLQNRSKRDTAPEVPREEKRYLIGIHPLEEAIRNGVRFHRLYLQKQDEGERFEGFIRYCKEHQITFFFADKQELDERSGGQNHQGVVAELKRDTRVIPDLTEYLEKNPMKGEVVLILDRITDQQNVGAIARSAYFFSCRLLISERSHSAPIDEVVHKTSSGASLMMAFHLTEKIGAAVEILKKAGFEVLTAVSQGEGATSLRELSGIYPSDGEKNYAIILGSEGRGIRPHLDRLGDRKITIPRQTDFDSLNVSVATGIILYAMREAGMIGSEGREVTEEDDEDQG